MATDPDRWRRLESVVHAALARPAEEREAFLAEACADDSDLRRDAASLLERAGGADGFLNTPLDALAAGAIGDSRDSRPALTAGQTLGHYRIIKPIGAGGMGQVYAAEDTRLDRQVAIKILPPELAEDADRRARFTREAKAVATLNHPNIVTVHAVEEADGRHFITMELVRGRTLAELLPRNGFALDEFLEIAIPLTDALAAAQQHGITHRDVKPTNVMVSDDGRVKVLDFGLAKAQLDVWNREGTLALRSATEDGHIVGTPAYMSPEQAEGKTVDARSDIFSLGIVLYEMLTGQRPFVGDSATATLSSILHDTPRSLSELKPALPRRLARLVHRCLEKNPVDRYQSAIDLRHDLEEFQRDEESGDAVPIRLPRPEGRRRTIAWAISIVLAAGSAAAVAWLLKPLPPDPPTVAAHLTIDLPPTAELEGPGRPVLALSPDGRKLVFAARLNGQPHLFLRPIDRLDAEELTETSIAPQPFFSPDGRWVGFQSEGALKKIAVGGGAPISIASVQALTGAFWAEDDHIVLVSGIRSPVSRVAASGGELREVTTFDSARGESSHRYPEVLPGGRVVMFTAGPPRDGPWHEADIVAQSLETGQRHTLIPGAAQARYVAPGYIVYARAGTLYAVPFDATSVRVTGPPVPVLEGVREDLRHGAAQFVVSANGTLAYVSGGLETTEVVLVDRQGLATPLMPNERRWFGSPRLSPDGHRLAVTVGGGNDATFVLDLQHGGLTRVTSDANHLMPTWTPDGRRITTIKSAERELVSSQVDQRDTPEDVVYRAPSGHGQPGGASWSQDGLTCAFAMNGDIWTLRLPERVAKPFIASRFVEAAPAISPDGRWLAYVSNESGSNEVYVQEFRPSGQRWRVSRAGGSEPVWSRDSQRLYFREGFKLLAVAARPPFAGAVELFETAWAARGGNERSYDVAADGERFFMIRRDQTPARIHVIFNWVEELKRRVPR
jgi:serine/threonine protein kinase/Tol biopolymer transport system component